MTNKKSLQGFSFIEVLISLFLLSCILLGLDAMELDSIKADNAAWLTEVAVARMSSLVERLRVVSAADAVDTQIDIWNQENKLVLPHGKGEVNGHFPSYTVTIYWGEVKNRKACKQIRLGKSGCLREKINL